MSNLKSITDKRVVETQKLFSEIVKKNSASEFIVTESTELKSILGISSNISSCLISAVLERSKNFCLVNIVTPEISPNHATLLEHTALKARARKCLYFITWNLKDTILWTTPKKGISVSNIHQVKNYIDIYHIEVKPKSHLDEKTRISLKERSKEIISDLSKILKYGRLDLVNIEADFFVQRLMKAFAIICPPMKQSLTLTLERDPVFREKITDWAALQGIPADAKNPEFSECISRQIAYRLLGKIIFYQSLRRSIKQLPELNLTDLDSSLVLPTLRRCFRKALEVDYHAVFKEDILDTILIPKVASSELAKLVDDLNTRDFATLPHDVVGEVFERLIPKEERHSLGQYFTPENLVDFALGFCIKSAKDVVMDPTCGTGTFLIRAYNHLFHLGCRGHNKLLRQLWGVDIAPFPAELATINIFRQKVSDHNNFPRIVCEDFFKVTKGTVFKFPSPKSTSKSTDFFEERIPEFDAVVGNFPYISQDKIEKRVKGYRNFLLKTLIKDWFKEYPQLFQYPNKKMQAEFERLVRLQKFKESNQDDLQLKISTYADIYAYLFLHAARFLKPTGRMGIVTSNAWIDVNFGYILQKFFLDNFKIIAILESRCEPWFEEASVNTILTIVERCQDENIRNHHYVKFVKVKRQLSDLITEDLKTKAVERWKNIKRLAGYIEEKIQLPARRESERAAGGSIRIKTVEDANFRIKLLKQQYLSEELRKSGKTVKWGYLLRAPEIYFELFEKASYKFIKLGEIAKLHRGAMTGNNAFYYFDKKKIEKWKIPDQFLKPLLKSPKTTDWILVSPSELNMWIFICRMSKQELLNKGQHNVLNYLNWGEKQIIESGPQAGLPWSQGAEVGTRIPGWWAIPPHRSEPAHVFFSKAYGQKHIQKFVEDEVIPDNRLYYLKPIETIEPRVLAAILNSSLVSFFIELTGRLTLGDGALELSVEDARDYLYIPDIRHFDIENKNKIIKSFAPLLTRPIESVFNEVKMEDRQEFDKVVLRSIGLSCEMLHDIYDGLQSLVDDRLKLAGMRNKSRRSKPQKAVARVRKDVLYELLPEGLKKFPEDFVSIKMLEGKYREVIVPEDSIKVHISPLFSEIEGKEGFKIQIKTPFEAKFILYAHMSGHKNIKLPLELIEISRAVKNYEIYIRELRGTLYNAYYKRTLDQQLAMRLTDQAFEVLNIPKPSGK